jgi:ribonuclease T
MPGPERVSISQRFRGFLPVIVDMETGGFSAATDAILEIAATIVRMDDAACCMCTPRTASTSPLRGRQHRAVGAGLYRHRPLPPVPRGAGEHEARASCSASCAGKSGSRSATAPSSSATTRTSMPAFSTPPWSAATSSATPSTPSPISTPRRWRASPTARRCWRKQLRRGRHRLRQRAGPLGGLRRGAHGELFCAIVNRWQELGGWPGAGKRAGRRTPEVRLPGAGRRSLPRRKHR